MTELPNKTIYKIEDKPERNWISETVQETAKKLGIDLSPKDDDIDIKDKSYYQTWMDLVKDNPKTSGSIVLILISLGTVYIFYPDMFTKIGAGIGAGYSFLFGSSASEDTEEVNDNDNDITIKDNRTQNDNSTKPSVTVNTDKKYSTVLGREITNSEWNDIDEKSRNTHYNDEFIADRDHYFREMTTEEKSKLERSSRVWNNDTPTSPTSKNNPFSHPLQDDFVTGSSKDNFVTGSSNTSPTSSSGGETPKAFNKSLP